jgi:hypothetical protein
MTAEDKLDCLLHATRRTGSPDLTESTFANLLFKTVSRQRFISLSDLVGLKCCHESVLVSAWIGCRPPKSARAIASDFVTPKQSFFNE